MYCKVQLFYKPRRALFVWTADFIHGSPLNKIPEKNDSSEPLKTILMRLFNAAFCPVTNCGDVLLNGPSGTTEG